MEAAEQQDSAAVDSEVEALHAAAAPDEPKPEEVEITAPVFPWELVLRQSVTFYQRKPSGGMLVKFCPAVRGPNGSAVPMPPGIVLDFSPDGWETFKREVAADGERPPEIQTATVLPGGSGARPPIIFPPR